MITEIAVNKPQKAKGSVSLVETMTGLDFIVDTAKRINEMSLSELQSRLPEFIQRRNQNAFVLGGVLERIRREKFWNPGSKQSQNASFERWVEETCHYSGRKARYLISVYVGLVQAAIPSSTISGIGWSKLRMIAPLLRPINGSDARAVRANRAHNDELVKLACKKSRKGLEAALKSTSTQAEAFLTRDETNKRRRFVFQVQPDDAEVVNAALAKIAKEAGHTGGAALVYMAKIIDVGGAMRPLDDIEVVKTA